MLQLEGRDNPFPPFFLFLLLDTLGTPDTGVAPRVAVALGEDAEAVGAAKLAVAAAADALGVSGVPGVPAVEVALEVVALEECVSRSFPPV